MYEFYFLDVILLKDFYLSWTPCKTVIGFLMRHRVQHLKQMFILSDLVYK